MLRARPVVDRGGATVRLETLYRIRFTYPETWAVGLEGGWEQHLMLAEGRCEGAISGRFRGANFPQRRTGAGPFVPDFRAGSMTSCASASARCVRRAIPT